MPNEDKNFNLACEQALDCVAGERKNWRADVNEISQDMEKSHLTRFSSLALFYVFTLVRSLLT